MQLRDASECECIILFQVQLDDPTSSQMSWLGLFKIFRVCVRFEIDHKFVTHTKARIRDVRDCTHSRRRFESYS